MKGQYLEKIKKTLAVVAVVLVVYSLVMHFETKIEQPIGQDNDGVMANKNLAVGTISPTLLWEAYYGGGFGKDQVIETSGEAVRISTKTDGGWYGAKADFKTKDLRQSTIAFKLRMDDWSAVSQILLVLSSDDGLENYYGLNLANYFANPAPNEWLAVNVETDEFETIAGTPDWANISTVAVRVVAKDGRFLRVWLDDVGFLPKAESKALVSLTFDDGFLSTFDVVPAMQTYQMTGTAFVGLEFIGHKGYLTDREVVELANLGWEIGGHSNKNLTELPAAEVDSTLAEVRAYLDSHNFAGREHFAYPNGSYNESVSSQVLEYFATGRTIDGFSQPTNLLYPDHINAVTISSATPISQVIKLVDQAKENGSWLVLVWHNFTDVPEKDTDYLLDDFNFLVEYLHKNNITVKPYGEAYQMIKDRQE